LKDARQDSAVWSLSEASSRQRFSALAQTAMRTMPKPLSPRIDRNYRAPKLKLPPGACDTHFHFYFKPMPKDVDLLDQMLDWVPEESTRKRIFVDNPAECLGFPPPAG
jgi:hypothetical protein